MSRHAWLLLPFLAACANEQVADWTTISAAEARFAIAEMLPQRHLVAVERAVTPNTRAAWERYRFNSGVVEIGTVFPGSKLTDRMVQHFSSRDEAEAAVGHVKPSAVEVLGAEYLRPQGTQGEAWLITYRTAEPGVNCTLGRGVLVREGRHDDRGFIYDTAIVAILCHRLSGPPPDMAPLFRALRTRQG